MPCFCILKCKSPCVSKKIFPNVQCIIWPTAACSSVVFCTWVWIFIFNCMLPVVGLDRESIYFFLLIFSYCILYNINYHRDLKLNKQTNKQNHYRGFHAIYGKRWEICQDTNLSCCHIWIECENTLPMYSCIFVICSIVVYTIYYCYWGQNTSWACLLG